MRRVEWGEAFETGGDEDNKDDIEQVGAQY
jgi:hypothetical protein